jgi:hypothetical protein
MQQVLRGSGFAWKRPVELMHTNDLYKSEWVGGGKRPLLSEDKVSLGSNVMYREKTSTCLEAMLGQQIGGM